MEKSNNKDVKPIIENFRSSRRSSRTSSSSFSRSSSRTSSRSRSIGFSTRRRTSTSPRDSVFSPTNRTNRALRDSTRGPTTRTRQASTPVSSRKPKNESKKKKKSNSESLIDGLLWYLPFFVRWPVKFFFWAFFKGLTNPLYLLGLFVLFTVIKRVVKNNTFEWSNYATNEDTA